MNSRAASLRAFETQDGEPRSFASTAPATHGRARIRPAAHVLIACMPKSGSTFLSDVIAELPGFRRADLTPAYGRREQELDEACLRRVDRHDFVAQHHVQYSDFTGELCRDYGVAPVVLVRSLLDVIVSLRDHLRNEGAVSPIFFAEPHHAALSDAQLELMIARLALPWYVNFYMSWRQAADALVVDYEELTRSPVEVIRQVMAFAGAPQSQGAVEEAVARVRGAAKSRLNVGVSGRGAALRPEVIRAVLELIAFYPEAADDRFIQAARAECLAALSGAPAAILRPAPARAAPRPMASLRRWWRRNGLRVLMRAVIPVGLSAVGVIYWLWPNDVMPDAGPHGYLDDMVFLLGAGLIAGRLTAYKPRLRPRVRG